MLSERLKKILALVKKTGDRVIVFDSNVPEDSFVIMSLEQYSILADQDKIVSKDISKITNTEANSAEVNNLTGDDLTDKINREISMWKNGKNNQTELGETSPKKAWNIPPRVRDNAQDIE